MVAKPEGGPVNELEIKPGESSYDDEDTVQMH